MRINVIFRRVGSFVWRVVGTRVAFRVWVFRWAGVICIRVGRGVRGESVKTIGLVYGMCWWYNLV